MLAMLSIAAHKPELAPHTTAVLVTERWLANGCAGFPGNEYKALVATLENRPHGAKYRYSPCDSDFGKLRGFRHFRIPTLGFLKEYAAHKERDTHPILVAARDNSFGADEYEAFGFFRNMLPVAI